TTDLVRSNNQYRVSVKANPTVPIIDVYSEASNAATAKSLANATVDGLRDYLTGLDRAHGVPATHEPRLEQLGRAQGAGVTGGGVNVEVAVLVFVFVFALSSAVSLGVARALRGWRVADEMRKLTAERP